CKASLKSLEKLGITWYLKNNILYIEGKSFAEWTQPGDDIDAQNSGTTARLISGLLANLPFETQIIGDASLSKRPMARIIDPLNKMGANIESNNNHLPLKFNPVKNLHGIRYELPVASAQIKSAVLLAGLFAEGETEVVEFKTSRDHTERMLQLNTKLHEDGRKSIYSSKDVKMHNLSMRIPGDFSSGAFFICAALCLPGSELILKNVSLNPTRTGLLSVLEKMGAEFEINVLQEKPEPIGELYIKSVHLHNIEIPPELVPNIIDEIPILSVLATQAHGRFLLKDAKELRVKESDRIATIVNNFRNLGIAIEEYEDGFELVGPQKIQGGKVETQHDHRIAMAFAVVQLFTEERIAIDHPECASVSFPDFYNILDTIVEK
ncbi:MAG TPA: 3-phosphoshikimate 1-carboxyvinyltransferase, partial [Caldithrix sp.]|nr:3-phosphoshikimate 1-carboxyvinyltransferase [Caldithrix sp.]